jgi:predicted O-methyltransferase YrrM
MSQMRARELARQLALRALDLRPTRTLINELVLLDRERRTGFDEVTDWPESLTRFEDLAFLFTSTTLAHGIAALRLDEAAYLYRLVRQARPRAVVEIGRLRGGSTLLLAAAVRDDATLYSYDLPVRYRGMDGGSLDAQLMAALRRYGLSDRVRLMVEDSRTADLPEPVCDLLFVDGDHSYEGVRADYLHWRDVLRPGGHVLFHDAVAVPDFTPTSTSGPSRLASELNAEGGAFARRSGAGSLAHFVKV